MPDQNDQQDPNTQPDSPSQAAPAGAPAPASPNAFADELTPERVRLTLRKVKDPELNLNIVDLGLVYDIAVEGQTVKIDMTLTSPGCPAGPQIVGDVERAVGAMDGVEKVDVTIVWSPFWSPDRIEPRVRAYMGL